MFAILRDHGGGEKQWEPFRSEPPTSATICMHYTDTNGSNTAASLVADLCADSSRLPVYWCSLYSPCLSVFQPIFIEGEIPPMLSIGSGEADAKSPWWLFRNLEAEVREDTTGGAAADVRAVWQNLEAELKITAYEIAVKAKKMIDSGQGAKASRILTKYMYRNLNKIFSVLKDFLPNDF